MHIDFWPVFDVAVGSPCDKYIKHTVIADRQVATSAVQHYMLRISRCRSLAMFLCSVYSLVHLHAI